MHGANLGVRLSSYDAVGGMAPLREREDLDLYQRLLAAGARYGRGDPPGDHLLAPRRDAPPAGSPATSPTSPPSSSEHPAVSGLTPGSRTITRTDGSAGVPA